MANRAGSSAETILMLQAVELRRLLRENKAMSDRVDTLIDEISRLRALHEKEQAQRRELQDAVISLMHKMTPEPRRTGASLRLARSARDRTAGGHLDATPLLSQRPDLRLPEIPAFLRRVAPN